MTKTMKTSSIIIFPIIILLSVLHSPAQAQDYYFETSEPLSDTLNTSSEESLPIYSPKDSTLFFVRTLHAENTGGLLSGQDIWYSKMDNQGGWSEPKNDLSPLNNEGNNAIVGISDSGKTFYLLNDYEDERKQSPGLSLAFNREDKGWERPQHISIPGLDNKQGIFYSLYVLPTEDVVLISAQMPGSLGQEDLYISFKDPFTNEWSVPQNLGPTINTGGYEMSPYLTEDKKTLYFSSNGHPGYGNADIFVAHRQDTTWTNWTRPENLGDKINSVGFDAYFTTNEDRQVFFVSNREGESADIYTSRMLTEEERQEQLDQRIQNEGRAAEIMERQQEASQMDNETQELIAETQALLDEFDGIKSGDTTQENEQTTAIMDEEMEARRVLFKLNAAKIQPDFTALLNEIVGQMEETPRLKVEIVGHADDTGGKDYNLRLSINRAIAVKQYLVKQGINERRIITYGKGATQPTSSNDTEEARKQNRRVVINFI